MKGSNYIPSNILPENQTSNQSKYISEIIYVVDQLLKINQYRNIILKINILYSYYIPLIVSIYHI